MKFDRDFTEEEREFFKSCDSFKNYSNIEEYLADIYHYLYLSSFHYSKEEVDKIFRIEPIRRKWVDESFAKKEPAADIAVDVGYFCG